MFRCVALARTDDSQERIYVFLRGMCRLLVTANVVPSSPILVTLMKEELSSSETSVLTRATRRNIPEEIILYDCLFGLVVRVPGYGSKGPEFDSRRYQIF
jgi:hypothetical protein